MGVSWVFFKYAFMVQVGLTEHFCICLSKGWSFGLDLIWGFFSHYLWKFVSSSAMTETSILIWPSNFMSAPWPVLWNPDSRLMSGGWGQCQASQRVTGKKRFASGGFGTGWLKDNDGTFTQSRWVFYNDNNNNSNNNNNNGFLYIPSLRHVVTLMALQNYYPWSLGLNHSLNLSSLGSKQSCLCLCGSGSNRRHNQRNLLWRKTSA